jgi:hypothetical protein
VVNQGAIISQENISTRKVCSKDDFEKYLLRFNGEVGSSKFKTEQPLLHVFRQMIGVQATVQDRQ